MQTSQIIVITVPGRVPERIANPCDAGDKAVGFDGAKKFSRFRVDLANRPFPVLPYPERAFRPGEARIVATTGAGIVESTLPVFGSIFRMRSSAI